MTPVRSIQEEHGIVGRDRELALSLAVLARGRHLLLEGPVGVGKTTVALAVCGTWASRRCASTATTATPRAS